MRRLARSAAYSSHTIHTAFKIPANEAKRRLVRADVPERTMCVVDVV